MCCMPEVEDVHYFVMGCPAYAHRRSKLLARISSCLEGRIDFDQLPDASKLHVLLGQRTGNPWAEGNVDRWVKVFLAKNWSQRSYVTETINMVLGATYSIYNTNF